MAEQRGTGRDRKRQAEEAAGGRCAPSAAEPHASGTTRRGYVVPIVHTRLPEPLVTMGFFGALAATAAIGIVDAPMAALIGAAVVVARHRRS